MSNVKQFTDADLTMFISSRRRLVCLASELELNASTDPQDLSPSRTYSGFRVHFNGNACRVYDVPFPGGMVSTFVSDGREYIIERN